MTATPRKKLDRSCTWYNRRGKGKDAMAPTPPLPVTEDTPPDMLAGSMDLRVVLPSGHSVKMSVERSTPMMDLLVQVTTVNKLSTGGHVLQAIGDRGVLPYKPSTPIGALDTWTIQVVPKSKAQVSTLQKKAPLKPSNQQQPFEQTFRLQVHLPRNQLYVMRVSPRTVLSDILYQTCSEKNLNPNKYELRHPANLSQLLDPSCTLADYGLQEVTVVARRTPGLGSALSSSDIMALQREEDKRRQQARQQHRADHGLGLVLNKRSQSSVCEGSVSSDSLGGRSISPARSDESASRSASPPAPSLPPMMVPDPPARPARKRRPAPKPPGPVDVTPGNNQHSGTNVQAEPSSAVNGKMNQVPVSHSRNSSDSSGYHEASVLSESPADGHQMPESCTAVRPKSRAGLSRSMSSLTGCQHSTSTTSLASSTGPSGQKKKKAAPPPPGMQKHSDQDICESQKTTSLERHLSGKTSSQLPGKCSTLPGKMKMSEHEYKSTMVEESREQKIPELEEDMISPDIQKIISSSKVDVTATNIQNGVSVPKQDEIGIPHITNNRHSERQDNANIAKVSKEVFPLADDVGVGKNEHSHVEKDVSEKKASVAVFPKEISLYSEDASVANFTKNPTQEDAKHLGELSPETDHSSVNSLSKNSPPQLPEYATASKETSLRASDDLPIPVQRDIVPVPATLPVERTATPEGQGKMLHAPTPKPRTRNTILPVHDSSRKKPLPPPRQIVGDSVRSNTSQKKRNGSVGQTFGVGATMLMLSGTDSVSSDSWEWQSRSSEDDDLDMADNDMEMFDMVEARNVGNASTTNQKLIDSYEDVDCASLASSAFEYDSEHETSEASSTLPRPPVERLLRLKGENRRGGSVRVGGKDRSVPACRGSSSSLRSMDETPVRMERWNNMESLVTQSGQSWVMGSDSETDAINQVEEAFRSVTEELDEQLPSPPADDLTVDWEYQLPAPPSAFRDSHSPTLTELGTVTLADAQVFQESSLSPEPVSLDAFTKPPVNSDVDDMLLGGSTTRTNPLFDPRYCEDESSVPQESTQSRRGELTNFTISTYQKPPVVEAIFNEYSDDEQISSSIDVFKKPVSYKYGSMSSLVNNSSTANLSRTNSFNSTENSTSEPPVSTASVKRSTSYICLVPRVNRTKSSENLSGQESKSAECDNVTAVSSQQGKSVSNLEAKGSSSNDNSATKSQVVMTEEERARLLALQEQFLQLQEQLLQNSNLLQPQQQDSPLQSLQVLRSILPQLKTSSNNTSSVTLSSETQQVKVEQEPTQPVKVEEEPVKQTAEKPANDNENKRYSYRGPPAINFATWSERPKSQVSIKQDRDYRIGIGQGGRVDDHKTGVSEAKHDATNADEPIRKVEPPSLSMRLISHTTASGFRKPASGSYQKSGSSNYVVENSCTPVSTRIECAPPPAPSDPSRVPIVRAVELKKSFLQQQNLLSDRDEQTFAGVNSLAKRFSSNVRLCRPASAYGKVENIDEVKGDGSTLSYKSVSSTNINTAPANVNTSPRRYTSVVGINSDFDRGLSSSSSFRDPTLESSRVQPRVSGPSVVRVNGFTSAKQLMPVVKGFQFATPAANKDCCPPNSHTKIHRSESTSGLRSWKTVGTDQQVDVRRDSRELKPEPVIKVTTTNQESQPPPPPVLAAALRKSTARPRPKTLPSPQQNPRDQLMDAIRNFGGRANLKQNGRS